MTNTKNRIRYGVLAFALTAAVSAFPTTFVHAASSTVDPCAGAEYETIQIPKDESMSDFVKNLTMLTSAEKQQLINEEQAAQPLYERIASLGDQIDSVTNKIVSEGKALFDERGRIFDEHEALWEKLQNNMNDQQNKLDNYTAIIKASTALTANEKKTLLKAQARLDELDAGIDSYYEKAARETRELTAQRDQAISELQALYAKSAHIWDKVYGK